MPGKDIRRVFFSPGIKTDYGIGGLIIGAVRKSGIVKERLNDIRIIGILQFTLAIVPGLVMMIMPPHSSLRIKPEDSINRINMTEE